MLWLMFLSFVLIITPFMANPAEEHIHGASSGLQKIQEYLGEFVYGSIDGSVTTFAVVAGASGAHLDSSVVIILGFANLIADGFAMSVGSYLSTKSELQNYEKHKQIEYWEIDNLRDVEVQEVRDIYIAKGFEGELLEQVVAKITEDKDRWVDTMMKEELEMIPTNKSPLTMGAVTFISFLLVGFVPLLIYVVDYFSPMDVNLFYVSSALTSLAFIGIGALKSYVTNSSRLMSIMETLLLGAAAASLAYVVGNALERMIT